MKTVKNDLYPILRETGYEKIREDLLFLQDQGYWKDGQPSWAVATGNFLACSAGSHAVTGLAWEFVAEEAVAKVEQLKSMLYIYENRTR
jgi:hypothetical protein